jgi:hypothetical protein
MAANGISTLETKELRQIAKLELAQTKRLAQGNARPYYDITQLPTQYNDNDVIDNENAGGLVVGRPWVAVDPTPTPFTLTETINTDGASIVETNVGPLTLAAKSSTYQVFPLEDGYIKVNGTTIKTTNQAAVSRGHTLAVISPAGATVGTIDTYDTFESAPADGGAAARAALTLALNAVASGNYIVMVSWDACSFDATLRTALNTGYGTTLTTNWAAKRYSHIVIAKKI